MTDPRWAAARALVLRHGWNAVAYQILNPGMRLWFSDASDAVAGHQSYAGVRVVAGAPVCALERLPGAAAELEADARAHGERVVFFGAGTRLERILGERGDHSVVRLGAQPAWDPTAWDAIVRHKASLRAQLHRARNKGVRIAEWPPDRAHAAPALRAVLHAWLATRGLPPLGFMVTPDLLGHTEDRRVFVAERGGAIVGFLVATPVPARDGWLVEQWPRMPDAPNGTTQLLVDAAMRAFADAGSRYATLGLSPLSPRGAEGVPVRPAWLRAALGHLRAHGRRFYNFRGLEAFKAGLEPAEWEPVYAIADGTRFTPPLLRGIAGVFSGGSPTRLMARAVASAAAHELRTMREALRASPRTTR
ncbi:MAG: phosphatidylglycerol lysyltransferase domain-containing protein [Gemmatirosa sp.]